MDNITTQLQARFHTAELEWRIMRSGKTGRGIWAVVVPYINTRAIQKRLDEVFGVFGWKNEYIEWHGKAQLCGISIKNDDNEWITKWDGAGGTDVEAIKGGLSDSMKRAAVQWGVGRYLYDVPQIYADIHTERGPGREWAKTTDGDQFFWSVPRDALAMLEPEKDDRHSLWEHCDSKPVQRLFRRAFDNMGAELRKANVEYVSKVWKAFEDNEEAGDKDMEALQQVIAWHIRAMPPNDAGQLAQLFLKQKYITAKDCEQILVSSAESLKSAKP